MHRLGLKLGQGSTPPPAPPAVLASPTAPTVPTGSLSVEVCKKYDKCISFADNPVE